MLRVERWKFGDIIFEVLQLFDTNKDDMEVDTEPKAHEQCEEYVKQVVAKQSNDISAQDEKNVDVISRLIYYAVNTLCLSK